MKYHLQVTRVTTQDDVEEEFIPCVLCPESVKRVLATMFDMSLITNKPFMLLNISAFTHMLGYYQPYFFFTQLALEHGVSKEMSTYILTVLGVSNIFGRIGCGIMSSMPNVKALPISILATIISGVAVLAAPWLENTIFIFAMAGLFGLVASIVITLRSIVIVDLLGLENLSNAFGINMVFQGVACLVGIPLGGLLVDKTQLLFTVFVFGGGTLILSAVLLIPLNKFKQPAGQDAQRPPPRVRSKPSPIRPGKRSKR